MCQTLCNCKLSLSIDQGFLLGPFMCADTLEGGTHVQFKGGHVPPSSAKSNLRVPQRTLEAVHNCYSPLIWKQFKNGRGSRSSNLCGGAAVQPHGVHSANKTSTWIECRRLSGKVLTTHNVAVLQVQDLLLNDPENEELSDMYNSLTEVYGLYKASSCYLSCTSPESATATETPGISAGHNAHARVAEGCA